MQKYAKYMQKMQSIDTTSYVQTISQKMLKYGLKPDLPTVGRSGVKYAFLHIYVQYVKKCSFREGCLFLYIYMQLPCRQQLLLRLPFRKAPVSREQQWRCFLLYWQSARIAANQRFCNLSPFYIRQCDVGCTPSDSQNAYDMQCNQERCVARLTC